jgi:hypothetical protein
LLFEKAEKLVPDYKENSKRARNLQMRSLAGTAAVLEARKEWAPAEEKLKAWIALKADDAPAHQRLGRCYFKLGNVAKAEEEFATRKRFKRP